MNKLCILSIQCALVKHNHYVKEPLRCVLVVHCNTDDWHVEAAKGAADVGETGEGRHRANK